MFRSNFLFSSRLLLSAFLLVLNGSMASAQVPLAFVKKVHFGPCTSTPTWVQKRENTTGANSTTLASGNFASSVGSGNLIVCQVDNENTGVFPSGVTDSKGNAYRRAAGPSQRGGWSSETWYAQNVVGGSSFNVTVTYPVAQNIIINCHEFSGVARIDALDKTAIANGTSASLTIGPVTTSSPGQLLYAYYGPLAGALNEGAGWTRRSSYLVNMVQTRNSTTAGSYSSTAILDMNDWYGILATFHCHR